MPTVSYKCPDTGKKMKKTFPYNAVGKAQASEFNKTMKGKIKYNPGYGMEKKTVSGY
tara:strand:- start:3452 stop:3622 length:171 start_codon:yes stop_codon:yes gene_type:complete